MKKEDYIICRMKLKTFKSLRFRFRPYKNETIVSYFDRLAEELKRIKKAKDQLVKEHHEEEGRLGIL